MSELSQPCTPTEILHFLSEAGVENQTREHAAVFTVEESQVLKQSLEPDTPGGPCSSPFGGHVKNLFLKNKKGQMWLLTLHENAKLDIKTFASEHGMQRLSFASADRLMENLGVLPGSVTPLALINDPDKHVTFMLDENLMACDHLHVHPLTNTMTTMISPDGLKTFLAALGRELKTVKI